MGFKRLVVGISGASGAVYGLRFLSRMKGSGYELLVLISDAARQTLAGEAGLRLSPERELAEAELREAAGYDRDDGSLRLLPCDDMCQPVASGSFRTDGMIVIPCSMATVSAIASGRSADLMERAADVTLKEGRRLVVVPRETPLSQIHLSNMLALSQMGVRIVAAMPGFYHHPRSIDDLIDFVVGKSMEALGIENSLVPEFRT